MELKLPFAVALLAAGSVALVSMLALMGRTERRGASPDALRTIHRIAGYAFAVCLAALVARGAALVSVAGDQLSLRVVFHIVLALGLVGVLVLKILIARFYRQLLKHLPALGMILFVLALIVTAISAGFEGLTRG